MKKFIVSAGLILTILLAVFVTTSRITGKKASALIAKCETLKLRDSQNAVLAVLGEPGTRRDWGYDNRKFVTWEYPLPAIYSTSPHIHFDSTGQATWIVCGESYSIGKNPLKEFPPKPEK